MQKAFKLLFFTLLTIFSCGSTDLLSAAENPSIFDLDQSKMTETHVEVATNFATTAAPVVATSASSVAKSTATAVKTTQYNSSAAYVAATPENRITIAGKTLEIQETSSTSADAGTHVNKYGAKFLYGHNSSVVFGGLQNLPVGATFSVTLNGQTKTYQIAQKVTFEKNNGLLQLGGDGNFMNAVVNASFDGSSYDLSIMTCAGTSLGHGDATHRLVVFAKIV